MTQSPAAEAGGHMRRILVVSYYFPPDAAVGGLRAAKFVRAFPEFGWEPLVLTVHDDYRRHGFDPGRLEGLEGVTIARTRELPRFWRSIRAAVWRLLSRAFPASNTTRRQPGAASAADRPGRETAKQMVKRWVISLGVLLPDDKKHWAFPATFAALRLVHRHKIHYVLTSGPPFSTHFIGLVARLLTGARWIADFRDPWIDMLPERFPHLRSRLSDALERVMETAVVAFAEMVIVTTPRMQTAFRARYARIPADRFVCIPNTIDTCERSSAVSSDVRPHNAPGADVPLTITYTGSLYFDRTPEPLFEAVGHLIASGHINRDAVKIRLVGDCESANGVNTRLLARRYGLDGVVDVIAMVPHREAMRLMRDSHLLLVLAPERHRLVVPAKVYDYLGTGNKLLAIAEPGATADLIESTGSGRCFSHTDVSGLADYLKTLVADASFRSMSNDPGAFSMYGIRQVTQSLVERMTPPSHARRSEVAVRA